MLFSAKKSFDNDIILLYLLILYSTLHYLILLNCSFCLKLSFFETYTIIDSRNWILSFISQFFSFHSHCHVFSSHWLFHILIFIHLLYISIISSVVGVTRSIQMQSADNFCICMSNALKRWVFDNNKNSLTSLTWCILMQP